MTAAERTESGRLLIEAAAKELVAAMPPWGVRMLAETPEGLVARIVHECRMLWDSVGLIPGLEKTATAETLAQMFAALGGRPGSLERGWAWDAFVAAISGGHEHKAGRYATAIREASPERVWAAIVAAMGQREWWRRRSLEAVRAIQGAGHE